MNQDGTITERAVAVLKKNKIIVILELLYGGTISVFLYSLSKLNKILLTLESHFEVLAYNNGQALQFFVLAFALAGIGVFIIYKCIQKIRTYYDIEDGDIILLILIIIMNIILLILIVIFINNPILRSIIVVGTLLSVYIASTN
ncbi:hypothetical protein M2475_001610 [Breznakia sp. PF5-3]|uniref:hypothetical protein n=1 Tax=unclassified Breznakia TaxID=2623764 RepID=UPI0024070984|nr:MULTISPECIES: hypothetical protein [unclassified Breznakia]MDF9825176.1 hypothetical protein [Breznakia sp. PM6-1]MDF9836034.1 hypothetical protein [Breznakia sp. PF5-3]MDF9838605.1 hypothetical protein [Breznakia sp. PFB2-8]MDF9860626.1 hypothetical protein [Breznakia sp. PH5-24]